MKQKFINQGLLICAVLILVILSSGCATTRMYTGEALPKEKIAVITGSHNQRFLSSKGVDVSIVSVNEEWLKKPYQGRFQRIEVIPGGHEILAAIYGIQCYYNGLWGWCNTILLQQPELELNVQAGHEYKIKVENWWKPGGFIVIVDTNTGEVILRNPLGSIF